MPLRHRTQSAALGAASDWIFNYLVVQITPISIENIRWRTYIIFFALNMVFAAVVFLFYPETSGRSLEDIDSIFMGDNDKVFVVDKRGRLLPGFRKVVDFHVNALQAEEVSRSEDEKKDAVKHSENSV